MILSPFVPRQLQVFRVRNLPSVPLRDKREIPYKLCGVYYCCRGNRVLYVGKSSNIYHRWNSYRYGEHHRLDELMTIDESLGDVDIHYQEWPEPLIGFIEAVEIQRFEPPMNKRMERIGDNINLTVLLFILKNVSSQVLIVVLSIAVIALLITGLFL